MSGLVLGIVLSVLLLLLLLLLLIRHVSIPHVKMYGTQRVNHHDWNISKIQRSMFKIRHKKVSMKWRYFSYEIGRCKRNNSDSAVLFVHAAHVGFAFTAH